MIEINVILNILFNIGIIGDMLKKKKKIVKPITNNPVRIIASDNLKIDTGSLLSSFFLFLAIVYNNIIPHIPVAITHKLEYCSCGINPCLCNMDIINISTNIIKSYHIN